MKIRYFRYECSEPGDECIQIWGVREDGKERVLYSIDTWGESVEDYFCHWHVPKNHKVIYFAQRQSQFWTEITEEEMFMELL